MRYHIITGSRPVHKSGRDEAEALKEVLCQCAVTRENRISPANIYWEREAWRHFWPPHGFATFPQLGLLGIWAHARRIYMAWNSEGKAVCYVWVGAHFKKEIWTCISYNCENGKMMFVPSNEGKIESMICSCRLTTLNEERERRSKTTPLKWADRNGARMLMCGTEKE